MLSKIFCLTLLSASLNVTAAIAYGATTPGPAPAGVKVAPTGGLVTTEAGGTATFTVVLKSQPTADVTIALASSNVSEGTVGSATLTFTASNWSTPQGVTVTGVDDVPCDGNVAYAILTAAARSTDRGYNNLDPDNVAVTNTDNDCARSTTGTATPTPHSRPRTAVVRISIKNVYDVALNFGPLGHGTRNGTDTATGVLGRQGSDYAGTVDAKVDSTQTMSGMVGSCGPATYRDNQKLKVTGHPVSGFNSLVQSVTFSNAPAGASPINASGEYLLLEFAPETMTSQQPGLRRPEAMLPDLVVSCHTLIDTLSGIAFLPLNDSRWTMDGGGYIINLPSSGVLDYTDDTVAAGSTLTIGPFKAKKSIWTIQVERLP